MRASIILTLALFVLTCSSTIAQQANQADAAEDSMFNIKAPTMGGKQFWTDHVWRRGWRIQHNAFTGHWRLINESNIRYAWGSRQQCQNVLEQHVPDSSIAATEAVVLLHGLMRSSSSMRNVGEYVGTELGLQPIYFEYASTRSSISDHAAALGEFIDSLPENLALNFVGHSMGNIVVRHYIGNLQRSGQTAKLNRIQTVVMLGPPNQGASIARQLAKTGVFGWVVGKGGLELGPGWNEFQSRLATPHCPFGVVAGVLPDSAPSNPLLESDGDFVVSLEETRLDGASDTLTVPRLHSFLMDAPEVQSATANFIRTRGQFPR